VLFIFEMVLLFLSAYYFLQAIQNSEVKNTEKENWVQFNTNNLKELFR